MAIRFDVPFRQDVAIGVRRSPSSRKGSHEVQVHWKRSAGSLALNLHPLSSES
jgi:hypothetical protein